MADKKRDIKTLLSKEEWDNLQQTLQQKFPTNSHDTIVSGFITESIGNPVDSSGAMFPQFAPSSSKKKKKYFKVKPKSLRSLPV